MRVEEVMHPVIVTCRSNQMLEDAARKLWDHDCGVLGIVNDQDKLVGMLSDRDICMAAFLSGRPLGELPIHTVMSRTVYAVTPDVSIREVEGLMSDQQIRRVPVVDADQHPVGIVTINDLVREAARPGARLSSGRVVQTLAAIGQDRSSAAAPTHAA